MHTATVTRLPTHEDAALASQNRSSVCKLDVTCGSCNLRELCLPRGLCDADLQRIEKIVYVRRRIKRGETLFNAGEPFNSVYAVRVGFFKTSVIDNDGREQVMGFFMGGELLGMDGVGSGRYNGTAIALEDSEVCVMPFSLIEDLASNVRGLQRNLHSVLAREIVRDHGVMMLLGSMCAEERLAAFLLNLSQRFTARGYSPSEFVLRMTREEIGSYLGLKLETVSRVFSKFQDAGLVAVQQKHIRITDIPGLREIIGETR
ncbi:MAG: fumarate/nitrate reduction transcriptional regulator Fnr [Burkholderiales bacterium]